uniref:Uncharacterized protein n=1 Tax=Anguilla anguilla TaxID=7936 RepID=A0A0E9U169_ANGAN
MNGLMWKRCGGGCLIIFGAWSHPTHKPSSPPLITQCRTSPGTIFFEDKVFLL